MVHEGFNVSSGLSVGTEVSFASQRACRALFQAVWRRFSAAICASVKELETDGEILAELVNVEFDKDPALIAEVFLLDAAAGGALPVMMRF